uniref:SCP domain-containing protein n=1 Tax=Xiphophorus couchianus TaxID=32473 RepID=A0A3B5MGM1_9TELE
MINKHRKQKYQQSKRPTTNIREYIKIYKENVRGKTQTTVMNNKHPSWDEALAISARAWAKHCNDRHNVHLREVGNMHPTFTSVGENIWTGPLDEFSVKNAIQKWVDEAKLYSYKEDRCTAVCDHYRQVVWAQSYKVGCAVVHCPHSIKNFDRPGAIFVCNYAPGGDIDGIQPYATTGDPCSGCKGECNNKMCSKYDISMFKSHRYSNANIGLNLPEPHFRTRKTLLNHFVFRCR